MDHSIYYLYLDLVWPVFDDVPTAFNQLQVFKRMQASSRPKGTRAKHETDTET